MSKYGLLDPGTCLPVLEALCGSLEIDSALEFGAGIWSTFSLTRNCKRVTSIENIEFWADKVYDDYGHRNNLTVMKWTSDMHTYLDSTTENFDLIFIDGENRIQCLNKSFNRSPIIVCHDTHQNSFNWHLTELPLNYKQLTYTGCNPYLTTIFYDENLNLLEILLNKNSFKHEITRIDDTYWTTANIVDHYKNLQQ